VPDLESEEDVGYFDDFSNEDDMAKYKEVYEKQLELSKLADRSAPLSKSAFIGFTYRYYNLSLNHCSPCLSLLLFIAGLPFSCLDEI